MATEPPPFVSFRRSARTTGEATSPSAMEQPVERIPVYQLALDFSKQLYTVVELTEGVERYYLRDTLDKKSTVIPMLVSRGLSMADMSGRRAVFRDARRAAADCAALLDVLEQRGTIEDEVLSNTRSTGRALIIQLDALTVPPPTVY